MKKIILSLCLILSSFSSSAMATDKLSVDLNLDTLQFKKPAKGVGKAGNIVFKTASVLNGGIVLNLNNVNSFFDSQIFLRPTFLGFTTKFGNYGFSMNPESLFNKIDILELQKSKLILDENQLNLSGETLKFVDPSMNIALNKFRLYCQTMMIKNADGEMVPQEDMAKNCLQHLTLNGSYTNENQLALMNYKSVDKATKETSEVQAKIKSIDVRKDQLVMNVAAVNSVSNGYYVINANDLSLKCAKDPTLTEFNSDKMLKDCLNQIKIAPFKGELVDKKAKTSFNLDVKDLTIKDKIAYLSMNSATLSDAKSTTSINGIALNCKKDTGTDLLDLMSVLKDCIDYSRISIAGIRSTKPDEETQEGAVSKIVVNTNASAMKVEADVKILGLSSRVVIGGSIALDPVQKQLTLSVKNTKLPLGLTSVKVLMYFLKKNLIAKDIAYSNNDIIISL